MIANDNKANKTKANPSQKLGDIMTLSSMTAPMALITQPPTIAKPDVLSMPISYNGFNINAI